MTDQLNYKIEEQIKKKPLILVFFYLLYVILLGLILGTSYTNLITPLVAPLSIIIGIFVWRWQESVKNLTATNETNKKKYNEKAEVIFGLYTKYEKSIQNINRLFTELRIVFRQNPNRKMAKSKEIANVMSKISDEVKLVAEIQIDLYNAIVLFFHLKSNMKDFVDQEINIYSEAHKAINNLYTYKGIVEKIKELSEGYINNEQSQPEKDIELITEYFNLLPYFESFNFGYLENEKEVIFTEPRKKFLELTKAI